MNRMVWVAAGLGAMLVAGVAVAQQPPSAPGAPPPPPGDMGPGGPGGMHPHMGPWARGMMHGMHRPPISKAAHFRFRKGDALVDIKCADDEPMKACVDAGSALMDKLAAQPK